MRIRSIKKIIGYDASMPDFMSEYGSHFTFATKDEAEQFLRTAYCSQIGWLNDRIKNLRNGTLDPDYQDGEWLVPKREWIVPGNKPAHAFKTRAEAVQFLVGEMQTLIGEYRKVVKALDTGNNNLIQPLKYKMHEYEDADQ